MMLSVLKHTSTPVKFWFLKNYLSPTLKVSDDEVELGSVRLECRDRTSQHHVINSAGLGSLRFMISMMSFGSM